MKHKRVRAAAVALPDGRVFVIGGEEVKTDPDGYIYGSPISSVEMCHLREPTDWQGPRKSSKDFWKDAADLLEPRAYHTAVAFRDSIFIADLGYYSSKVEVFNLPDNERPLGQWTRLANWDTCRGTAALVVCQDRLFTFRKSFFMPSVDFAVVEERILDIPHDSQWIRPVVSFPPWELIITYCPYRSVNICMKKPT
ncbi:unnamed protein product [Dibothriocephalus latus]|uniref:Sema domain-containing protein n=1 Tax=Dibothriocephalus latus TaxID=60516 RepID=A0A3P7LPF5_DIBLA|nr:unnamed protein product [Dibothriocephalus latus]